MLHDGIYTLNQRENVFIFVFLHFLGSFEWKFDEYITPWILYSELKGK